MTRVRLSLITALVLGGCQSREVVKLALDFDPPPAGLFVIPPVTAGGAPLVAIDPATGEGLELLVRQDPDEDAPWTAVLLKQPLSELGIEPGALSVGSGNRFWRRDYRVAQAVVGAASHPFQAVDGDPVIEALGLPFWEVRSPSFSLPCKRPQVLPITLASPEIVTAFDYGTAIYLIGQSLFERGPRGLEPRRRPLAPPVVSVLDLVTGADLGPYVSTRGPDTVRDAFVTAVGRSYAGRVVYAAVQREPALKTELWSASGVLEPFSLAATLDGVEVRYLAVESGAPGSIFAMTDRGTLLKVDDATGTTTMIATGTSTGGSCRRFGETAPSVQCGLLTMDSISADVLWTQPRGDPTIGWLPREGGASTRSIEPPDQRVLAFLPGSRLVASSTRASERISVANGLGNPDWTSAPLIAFSEPLSQAGNSIGIDRNGTLLDVRDDGTLCASLSQDQRARRLFTVGYTVLGVGPLFVDGGASVENQQHLSFIRVR